MSHMLPFIAEYCIRMPDGTIEETGSASVVIEGPGLEVTPGGKASIPIRFAHISCWNASDYCFSIILSDSAEIRIMKLARRFDEFIALFRNLRREFFMTALLLEEGERSVIDGGSYELQNISGQGTSSGPCSVCLQRTSLVCFPDIELPFLIPYGSMTAMNRDSETYGVKITCIDGELLTFYRFGKRTDELLCELEIKSSAVSLRQSAAIASLAPDLGVMILRRGAELLRDGVPASREHLESSAPGLWNSLWQSGFCQERRPYAEWLLGKAGKVYVVLKETGTWGAGEDVPAALADRRLLYLFRMGDALVVEAPSADDVATYVFRISGDVDIFTRNLCRAFAAIQFRREPIYLPQTALTTPPNDRYAEAVRILPSLADARKAFAGRAIHSSIPTWQKEIDDTLIRMSV